MPPKRLPIVSTGRPKSQLRAAATPTAITKAGQCGRKRRMTTMIPIASTVTAMAAILADGKASPSIWSLGMNAPGSLPVSVKPSSSLSWLLKITTAMPDVNPTVTGYGIYLMKMPSLRNPTASRISPESMVARMNRPRRAVRPVAATSTMKAPAGPPI